MKMKCLYTTRNNSFNRPIFQSKLIELLSRNYKNKKKITLESLSFRQKLSTSKISQTNSYINSNMNTNTNSIIKQSGNNTKRKNSKNKININSMHKCSMSNDNFNENSKKIRNFDVITGIYPINKNSRNKNKNNNVIINSYNNKKASKSKNNNNCTKIKRIKNKKINNNNKIMINMNNENDLSLKRENQILKLKLIELQSEIDKLKNENGLLISQNRNRNINQNSILLKQREKRNISNEMKTKKTNKLSNNLNLRLDNIDSNYPNDYFNIIYSNNNFKNTSLLHNYINSNKSIYSNNITEKNVLSYNTSRNNINYEQKGNFFTIGNSEKIKSNSNNVSNIILNSSKNKNLLSMSIYKKSQDKKR